MLQCRVATLASHHLQPMPGGRNYAGNKMPRSGIDIQRIEEALIIVAKLVSEDPIYAPIFERLEKELKAAKTIDPVERARKIVEILYNATA
jgi:hypothetical protein